MQQPQTCPGILDEPISCYSVCVTRPLHRDSNGMPYGICLRQEKSNDSTNRPHQEKHDQPLSCLKSVTNDVLQISSLIT